ncbi:hypothetical protein H696_04488 [Fonticula alba]|uniref:DNA 3'-5' helicase n=1 Tax=Fonticula alba TaxID=691883 RepID=A0A058Z575_FONAL|nr:hypothetical protein H696_04488 [Fonticula alba]KCV69073.1 hypothetical protein H696_04488 [Fonticula alba]|eukprot:XP_009496644.1 hypothetical protein H696_04488 [Fonticula alba]
MRPIGLRRRPGPASTPAPPGTRPISSFLAPKPQGPGPAGGATEQATAGVAPSAIGPPAPADAAGPAAPLPLDRPPAPEHEYLLRSLNEEQRTAVVANPDGVLIILAGPGTGKTRTITHRLAYLLSACRLPPASLVMVTFTKKAAEELKSRTRALLGASFPPGIIIGTFHNVCNHFLRLHHRLVGLQANFRLIDEHTSRRYMLDVCSALGQRLPLDQLSAFITEVKRHPRGPEDYLSLSASKYDQEFATFSQAYRAYAARCREANVIDFEDSLILGERLFKQHPEVLQGVRHVLVDEFQDTCDIQFSLTCLLAGAETTRVVSPTGASSSLVKASPEIEIASSGAARRRGALTIVGDPDQSIYGFRKANVHHLTRGLGRIYGAALRTVELGTNYRSSGCIVAASRVVIEQDTERKKRDLRSAFGSVPAEALPRRGAFASQAPLPGGLCPSLGPPVAVCSLSTPGTEATFIGCEIKRLIEASQGLLSFSDMCVLVRENRQFQEIEQALSRLGIPHTRSSDTRVDRSAFGSADARVLHGYLAVGMFLALAESGLRSAAEIIFPRARLNAAFCQSVNSPSRMIGPSALDDLRILAGSLPAPGSGANMLDAARVLCDRAPGVGVAVAVGVAGPDAPMAPGSQAGEGTPAVGRNAFDVLRASAGQRPAAPSEPIGGKAGIPPAALAGWLAERRSLRERLNPFLDVVDAVAGLLRASPPVGATGQSVGARLLSLVDTALSRSGQPISSECGGRAELDKQITAWASGFDRQAARGCFSQSASDRAGFTQPATGSCWCSGSGPDAGASLPGVCRTASQLSPDQLALAAMLARWELEHQAQQRRGQALNAVAMSSLHSAKGLEWPVVFIAGVEEGFLPHRLTVNASTGGDVEAAEDSLCEELRLLYVGMTRAQAGLYLTSSSYHCSRGESQWPPMSRFLRDLNFPAAGCGGSHLLKSAHFMQQALAQLGPAGLESGPPAEPAASGPRASRLGPLPDVAAFRNRSLSRRNQLDAVLARSGTPFCQSTPPTLSPAILHGLGWLLRRPVPPGAFAASCAGYLAPDLGAFIGEERSAPAASGGEGPGAADPRDAWALGLAAGLLDAGDGHGDPGLQPSGGETFSGFQSASSAFGRSSSSSASASSGSGTSAGAGAGPGGSFVRASSLGGVAAGGQATGFRQASRLGTSQPGPGAGADSPFGFRSAQVVDFTRPGGPVITHGPHAGQAPGPFGALAPASDALSSGARIPAMASPSWFDPFAATCALRGSQRRGEQADTKDGLAAGRQRAAEPAPTSSFGHMPVMTFSRQQRGVVTEAPRPAPGSGTAAGPMRSLLSTRPLATAASATATAAAAAAAAEGELVDLTEPGAPGAGSPRRRPPRTREERERQMLEVLKRRREAPPSPPAAGEDSLSSDSDDDFALYGEEDNEFDFDTGTMRQSAAARRRVRSVAGRAADPGCVATVMASTGGRLEPPGVGTAPRPRPSPGPPGGPPPLRQAHRPLSNWGHTAASASSTASTGGRRPIGSSQQYSSAFRSAGSFSQPRDAWRSRPP